MNIKKTTGIVVQMRIDSRRLPGKALLELGDSNLAGIVMRRLRTIEADHYILASDKDGVRELASTARASGFTVYEGPKDDVLGRFALAIDEYGIDVVVRATGDNPFVSSALANIAITKFDELSADYVGLIGMPLGMGVEIVSAKALLKASRLATSSHDREHVCPYLYEHPLDFIIARPACPNEYFMPLGRLTVDTADDYTRARNIVKALGDSPSDAELLTWLLAEQKGA